jgi:hypothetical protein
MEMVREGRDSCLASASAAPDSVAQLAALKAASSYQRRDLLVKTGWATMLGSTEASLDVAQACQLKLAKAF